MAEILTDREEVALLIEYDFRDFLSDLSSIFKYYKIVRQPVDMSSTFCQPPVYTEKAHTPAENLPLTFSIRENALAMGRRRYPSPERLPAIALAAVRASLDKPLATIIGCKSPYFFVDHTVRGVLEDFETIKYILMVRRPFGQINSSLNRGNRTILKTDNWPILSVESAIDEYRWFLAVTISFALLADQNCLIVKYEDFINSHEELLAVGHFLGVDGLSDRLGIIGLETEHTVLTERDRSLIDRELGRLENIWLTLQTSDRRLLASALALGLRPVREGITLYNSRTKKHFLGFGWSLPEDTGVWSSSEWADLVFAGEGEWLILASFIPYIPMSTSLVTADVTWNGASAGRIIFTCAAELIDKSFAPSGTQILTVREKTKHTLSFGPFKFAESSANILKFTFGENLRPPASAVGGESRLVNLKLCSLQFLCLSPTSTR